jgi:hypothetical protein
MSGVRQTGGGARTANVDEEWWREQKVPCVEDVLGGRRQSIASDTSKTTYNAERHDVEDTRIVALQ